MISFKAFGSIEKKSIQITPTIKEKCSFTWIIKNFQSRSNSVGYYNESPRFYSDTNQQCQWSVDIFLGGCDENSLDYVGIRAFLFNSDRHVSKKFAFKCSVLDKNDKESLGQLVEVINGQGYIRNLVSKNDVLTKSELLPNGELRVACEILDLSEMRAGKEVQCSLNIQTEICKTLFDTKKFSDFKLVVQGKEFCVHRAILSARSPVFEAMFESNMRETSKGEAHIDDIEAEVIEKLLRFTYSGETDFENLVDKMLVAADKYQLDFLKSHCESILAKTLNIDNVYDVLLLADQVSAMDLKTSAMEFFDDNKKKLASAHDFKSLIGSLPKELLIDIISSNALKP